MRASVGLAKSGATKAAIEEINCIRASPIAAGSIKYLNNLVEQQNRAIKRVADA